MPLDTEPGTHIRMEDFCFGCPDGVGVTVSLDINWEEVAETLLAQPLCLLFWSSQSQDSEVPLLTFYLRLRKRDLKTNSPR